MMKEHENFKLGLVELTSNKMRTGLTMLGIIFGVASVIAMLSIGEGARQETLEQIEILGTNNIIINKKAVSAEAKKKTDASFSPGLTLKDAVSIEEINPFIEHVTPQKEMELTVIYKSKIVDGRIIGTTETYPDAYNSRLKTGNFFTAHHNEVYANVCVIGSGIKRELFSFEAAVGKEIKIGDLWFRVVGVMNPKNISSEGAESFGLSDFNLDIYIPYSTMVNKLEQLDEDGNQSSIVGGGFMMVFGSSTAQVNTIDRTSVDKLTAKIKKDVSITSAAELIERTLNRKHYGMKDYEIIIPEELLEQKQQTQKIFNVVMGAIAGISLLVGGIGIMNIMLSNILERTREIGIRRAVGATRQNVLRQFMYEAVVISVVGGVLGIFLGFILTSLITSYADWRTSITTFSVLLAFIVSVCVGLIFGIYPAKKAAEKDPIESLRYE